MNAAGWQRIRELFEAALLLPPDQREGYVRQHSDGDDALVQEETWTSTFQNFLTS